MALIDVEVMLKDVKAKLTDEGNGVNAQINAVNIDKAASDITEYGAPMTLGSLDAAAIYLLVAKDTAINYSPFISVTLDEYKAPNELRGEGGRIVIGINITVEDIAQDNTADIRLLRYQRAVEKVFLSDRFIGGLPVEKIGAIDIIALPASQYSKSWLTGGILLELIFG